MKFQPPTVAHRGQLARIMAEVYEQRPKQGEIEGRLRCVCGASLSFNVQSSGISRGRCTAACGVAWVQ